jgi:hypothetical protein
MVYEPPPPPPAAVIVLNTDALPSPPALDIRIVLAPPAPTVTV